MSDIHSLGDWWLRWRGGLSSVSRLVDRCAAGQVVSWMGVAVAGETMVAGSDNMACMGVAAKLIREARHAAGLTMSELAERAGTSKPTVSRYENGLVDPGAETLNRLLHACGQRLQARPAGLPSSVAELAKRFEGRDGPDADDVTRTSDGRELRTAADLEAFAAELRADGLLAT